LKNITLYALNGVGFSRVGDLISGNPTGVHLVSEEIAPLAGFSPEIGPLSSFNYSIDLPSYPCNATLSTKIWEGTIPAYDARLLQICSGNVPPAVPIGTAYTAKITRTNIPSAAPVTLHMSVNSAWNGLLSGGPGNVSIWRISDDGTTGQVLQTEYLYSDPVDSLDFFTANTSQGLSTFGLSSLTGGNNPFQLITLTIISVISEPPKLDEINTPTNPAVKSTIPVTLQTPAVPATIPVPADPGKTAKIYANAQGVITQETTLQSTDGLASFTLGLGIAAKDDSGKPLESISITRTPETSLPAAPPGGALSFAGMAYDLQPDGATFSPSIPVSFTVPQAQWGKEFTLQEYDRASGTWQALPSKYDPQTGTITADVSHFCCFGLFAKSVTPSSTPAAVNEPVKAPTKAPVPPPTAMSTFSGMVLWITQNPLVIAGIIILVGVVVFYEQKKRRLNKRF
jgi:hypothetical protein